MNKTLIYSLATLMLIACGGQLSSEDEKKKKEEAKAQLTCNVVSEKDFVLGNSIEPYAYEFFSVGDSFWTDLHDKSVQTSLSLIRGVDVEGLYSVSGVEYLGRIGDSWQDTEVCEGLWDVVLYYREVSLEVVNGLDEVVCRYTRRDNFSRLCSFVGFRQRETIDVDIPLYQYTPMPESDVPDKCSNRSNSSGFYDSAEIVKNDKDQVAFINLCEYIADNYSFDFLNLEMPVSYTPPVDVPNPGGAPSGGGSGADDLSRPYKYIKSVNAYTLYSDGDVDKFTLYIYKGPTGDRASSVYNPNGLEISATDLIRRGSATIDGKSYSCYVSSFGVPSYFNY